MTIKITRTIKKTIELQVPEINSDDCLADTTQVACDEILCESCVFRGDNFRDLVEPIGHSGMGPKGD